MERNVNEVEEGADYVGYKEAFNIISSNINPGKTEKLTLALSVGRIAAGDILAEGSYPSADVTLKDGYAVISADVENASARHPVRLKVTGSVYAGLKYDGKVKRGNAVKGCSGAPIPGGADAVVSGEFCEEAPSDAVLIRADAGKGRNVLTAGGEVKAGETIVRKGERLLTGYLGLAAAAGISR